MVAFTPGLDRSQITFLENNFVVYDPLYRECYLDFSGLEKCQVILIGEMHHSSILQSIQRLFLEIMIGKQPACVLAEGLKPGETFNAPERVSWQGLPTTLQVRGADDRGQCSSTVLFLEWERLNHRAIQLELADKELVSGVFRQIAALLNGHFRSNSSGVDPQNKVFLVTDGILQAVEKLYERLQEERGQRDKEIVKIHAQMNAMIKKKTTDPTVVRSNQGLFQEIEKVYKQFSKVIAIWGKGHFVCDDELVRALDRASISYVILLPNAQREKEATDEIEWGQGSMSIFELIVEGSHEEITIKVPKIFQSYFHPAIQTICQMKAEEPIVLDFQKLLQLAKQGNTLNFSAGQKIHFEHVPLADYHRLEELHDRSAKETKLTEAQSLAIRRTVNSILNNILMLGGLNVESMVFDGQIRVDHTCLKNKLVLILSSDKPFHLTLAKNTSLGYAGYLFQEMRRLNLKRYSVHPQERLYFIDLSAEEKELILRSPNGIKGWLNSKLPFQTQLSLHGQITVQPAYITSSEDSSEVEVICLTTKTGFTFTLS